MTRAKSPEPPAGMVASGHAAGQRSGAASPVDRSAVALTIALRLHCAGNAGVAESRLHAELTPLLSHKLRHGGVSGALGGATGWLVQADIVGVTDRGCLVLQPEARRRLAHALPTHGRSLAQNRTSRASSKAGGKRDVVDSPNWSFVRDRLLVAAGLCAARENGFTDEVLEALMAAAPTAAGKRNAPHWLAAWHALAVRVASPAGLRAAIIEAALGMPLDSVPARSGDARQAVALAVLVETFGPAFARRVGLPSALITALLAEAAHAGDRAGQSQALRSAGAVAHHGTGSLEAGRPAWARWARGGLKVPTPAKRVVVPRNLTSPDAGRALAAQCIRGTRVPKDDAGLVARIAAQCVGARKTDASALRHALLRAFLVGTHLERPGTATGARTAAETGPGMGEGMGSAHVERLAAQEAQTAAQAPQAGRLEGNVMRKREQPRPAGGAGPDGPSLRLATRDGTAVRANAASGDAAPPAGDPRNEQDRAVRAFAGEVLAVTDQIATGWSGHRKALVRDVWAKLQERQPKGQMIDLAAFKAWLLAAHRHGHLVLVNADLREREALALIQSSEIVHGNMRWHYVRAPVGRGANEDITGVG